MITIDRDITRTPIEDRMVVGRIVDVVMLYEETKSFSITIEILNGKHVGELICDDKFHGVEQGKYFWKFKKLMKSLGKKRYSANTDLKKSLINQYILLMLSIFTTENRLGKELKFQNITYCTCPYSKKFLQELTDKVQVLLQEKFGSNTNVNDNLDFKDSGNPFIE